MFKIKSFIILSLPVTLRSAVKNNWKDGIPLPRHSRNSYASCTDKYHKGIEIILQGCLKSGKQPLWERSLSDD